MTNVPNLTLEEPVQMFHMALTNDGIPINGVATLDPAEEYPPEKHVVVRDDGLVVDISYLPEATPEQIVEGDQTVMTLDISPKRVRRLWDIYADIALLSSAQKDAIRDDIKADNGAKIKSFGPPYDGIMMALDWGTTIGNPTQTRDAYARIAAMYTQQNIYYLEQPDFAPTINILGWEFIEPVAARAKP
jgi:hypothetical protein